MSEADELRAVMRHQAAVVRTLAHGLRSGGDHAYTAERLLGAADALSEASGFGLRVLEGGKGDGGSAA